MTTAAPQTILHLELRGGALDLFRCRDGLLCMDGPAGTGKTLAALEKIHLAMWKYPGARGFLARKTLLSLKGSTLATFREKVLHPGEVRFWSAKGDDPAHYAYSNGSKLYIIGLDNTEKIKSWEFDIGLVDEATEASWDDIQKLDSRMRNNVMPYQQIVLCTNPGPPSHWLNEQMTAGRITRLLSRHEDNPALCDAAGVLTTFGKQYITRLEGLTGVLFARLRLGLWVQAEGTVYENEWDEATHLIDRFAIPSDWPRYVAIDFGYRNPFVAQWWAMDHDGRLYMYREIYMTERLVEDHARVMLRAMGYTRDNGQLKRTHNDADPLPRRIICDHDTEDRYTLERHTGLITQPAYKDILMGIEATKARLMRQGDGKPRLFFFRDALVEVDKRLMELHRPISTTKEMEVYAWDTSGNQKKGDQPVDADNHGLDAARYIVSEFDLKRDGVGYIPSIYE